MNKNKALISAFVFSIIIGLSFMFVKISLLFESQILILAHRFLFAMIPLIIFIGFKKDILKVNLKELLLIIIISIFYPIIFFSTQILGLNYTTVTEAGIIQAIAPAISIVLAFLLLRERTTKIQIIGVLMSISGVIILQFMGSRSEIQFNILGNILILLSVFATAVYQVLSRKVTQTISSITVTTYIIIIGFIFFNTLYFTTNDNPNEYLNTLIEKPEYLFSLLFLGILSTFGTSLLSIYAVSQLPIIQVSVFNNLATLITVFSGVILLNETLYLYHIAGFLIIILGVLMVNFKR